MRSLTSIDEPPSKSHLKALRALCLLLKVTTTLHNSPRIRQIKDKETFTRWDRIQQYINSDQGCAQIQDFMQVVQGDFTMRLQAFAIEQLEQIVFSYLPTEVVDLESPRVKNRPLKPFFDLAYFFVMLVRVLAKI